MISSYNFKMKNANAMPLEDIIAQEVWGNTP